MRAGPKIPPSSRASKTETSDAQRLDRVLRELKIEFAPQQIERLSATLPHEVIAKQPEHLREELLRQAAHKFDQLFSHYDDLTRARHGAVKVEAKKLRKFSADLKKLKTRAKGFKTSLFHSGDPSESIANSLGRFARRADGAAKHIEAERTFLKKFPSPKPRRADKLRLAKKIMNWAREWFEISLALRIDFDSQSQKTGQIVDFAKALLKAFDRPNIQLSGETFAAAKRAQAAESPRKA